MRRIQAKPSSLPARALLAPGLVSLGLLLAGVSGCERADPELPVEPPERTVPGAAPVDPSIPGPDAPVDDNASMHYTCEGGWNVAIVGDTAHVTAGDGRVIALQRVPDRSPPLFAGEALEFSVDGGGAVLGQDEGGPFTCEESG